MKRLLMPLLLLLVPVAVMAQFTARGKISYERRTNVKLKYKTEDQSDFMKSILPKLAPFTISEFSLLFNEKQSRYQFDQEREVTGMVFNWEKIGWENKVLTDFSTHKVSALKNVYESTYLVEDSMLRFRWKIEDEMRTIAGYPCRKAVTRICDSVVVVAFYTEQIMVSGGPEGFNGLPGMILGIAIPRLYTTWFATEVSLVTPEILALPAERKQKKVNNSTLLEALKKGTKDWGGSYGTRISWWLMF
jgi:GLPGLI family protein